MSKEIASKDEPFTVVFLDRATGGGETKVLEVTSDGSLFIKPGSLPASDLADGSVTTPKLAAGAVTAPKLGAGSVTAPALGALAVGTAALAALAVTTAKLALGSVDSTILAANAVTAPTIAANAVTTPAIAAASVTGPKLASNLFSAAEQVSASGALSITLRTTILTVSATKAYTLSDGSFPGQRKTIFCRSASAVPVGVVTPAHPNNFSTLTFSTVNGGVELEWNGTAWDLVSVSGSVVVV